MSRTRLRGLELLGVRTAVEVPPGFDWSSGGPGEPPSCAPFDPEVYVGVRVGSPALPRLDCQPVVYHTGRETFEVGRRGGDWWIAVHGWERFERVARFDADFRTGDVSVSRGFAASRRSPLAAPLDELVVLHRMTRGRGLILRGHAAVRDGAALLVLGAPPRLPGVRDRGWCRLESRLGAGDRIVLTVSAHAVRAHGEMPADDGLRATSARVEAIHVVRESGAVGVRRLEPDQAVSELLGAALAPVHAPESAERLIGLATRVANVTPVHELCLPGTERVLPFDWGQRHAGLGFGLPALA